MNNYIETLLLNTYECNKRFRQNDFLFKEGSIQKGIYFILDGTIKIVRTSKQKRITMWFAEKNELVGISSFFNESSFCSFGAIAFDNSVKTLFIPIEEFRDMLSKHPIFKQEIIKTLCQRIGYTENRIRNFKAHKIKRRVAEALLFFLGKKTNNKQDARIQYSLKDLADFVGSSKQSVLKLLKEFQQNKVLKIENHSLLIYDTSRLIKYGNAQ